MPAFRFGLCDLRCTALGGWFGIGGCPYSRAVGACDHSAVKNREWSVATAEAMLVFLLLLVVAGAGAIGVTKTFTVTLKKGTYKFYCQPHESTMFGNFTVS